MKKNNKEIAASLTESVFRSLKKDLIEGNVNILEENKRQLPLIMKYRQQQQYDQKEYKKLLKIVDRKKKLEVELNKLKDDEKNIEDKRIDLRKQNYEKNSKNFRSTMTPDQKQKICEIIKYSKKFEQISAKKTELLNNKIKSLSEKQQKQKQMLKRQLHLKRKKQSMQKIKQIQVRRNSRLNEIRESNKLFQKISNTKSLYQIIQQKSKNMSKEEQQKHQKIFQQRRKHNKFDVSQIKNHGRRYSEILSIQKQKRVQNMQKLKEHQVQHFKVTKQTYSPFYQILKQQEDLKKQQLSQKIKQNSILNQKKAFYAQTVRERHKSNFKPKNSSKIQSSEETIIRTSNSLDCLELKKLGNSYMRQIHSLIGIDTQEQFCGNTQRFNEQKLVKYSDYLTEARLSRNEKNQYDEPLQIKQLRSIIRRKNDDRASKLQKAKKLVEKIDERVVKRSKHLINSIMAKISIIEQFSEGQF